MRIGILGFAWSAIIIPLASRLQTAHGSADDFDRSELETFAEEANVAIKQLMEESDRGAVLVGVAYLDDLLLRLFKRMLLDKTLSEELFGGSGPLSNLSGRIKVAYCLGWIGPATFRDLDLLRRIRNDFAHLHKPITFTDPSVQSRCRDLEMPKGFLSARFPRARDQFLCTVSMLILRLEQYRRDSRIPESGWDPPVTASTSGRGERMNVEVMTALRNPPPTPMTVTPPSRQ